jgi:AcrR family transcriptional regulator
MPRGAHAVPLETAAPSKGELTRRSILGEAVQLASVQGLEGLSIGQLAEATGMSKAGLFAHFGSKEDLQLATVQAARTIFIEQVVAPSLEAPAGLPRLVALCRHWLDYAEREVFRGGCFFASAASEFDGRPGPVRDLVAAIMVEWMEALEKMAREALDCGHLQKQSDLKQLVFELQALMSGANSAFQLHRQPTAFRRARTALRDRLKAFAAPGTRLAPL